MKKQKLVLAAMFAAMFIAMIFTQIGCSDDAQNVNSKIAKKSTIGVEDQKTDPNYKPPVGRTATYQCGSAISGNYAGVGSYTYPDIAIDLSSIATGATVTIALNSYDNPNRVRVFLNGSQVVSSTWIGCTSNGGWWGAPFCNTDYTQVSFVKGASSNYVLKVDTDTKDVSDSYTVTVLCPTCSDGVKDGFETGVDCGGPSCYACCPNSSCGKMFKGNKSGVVGPITYANVPLVFCLPTSNVSIKFKAFDQTADVPNRFTIYDNSNNVVGGTSWIGYSNHGGTWGANLLTAPNEQTVSFTYNSAKTYYVKVETFLTTGESDTYRFDVTCL